MKKTFVNILLYFIYCCRCIYCVENEFSDELLFPKSGDEYDCNLPPELKNEIEGYREIVEEIIYQIVDGNFSDNAYESLKDMLNKQFGPKAVGNEGLEKTIKYIIEEMTKAGLENIHTEESIVLHSKRGNDSAELLYPETKKLNIAGLGTSIGTPPEGIVGDVVVVRSFEELQKIPDEEVNGKIVIFASTWKSTRYNMEHRIRGATEASKKGAIAALIRTRSEIEYLENIPFTGMHKYEVGVRKIPAASITIADAEMLIRMYRKGERIQIRLKIEDTNPFLVSSPNTIAELTGTTFKNTSVVVLSAHIDDWLLNWLYPEHIVIDDSGGALISWKVLQFLKEMGLRPKRTIRTILWTGEKFGAMGAQTYQDVHKMNEQNEFNFFLESDNSRHGSEGFEFSGNHDAVCIIKEILNLMKSLDKNKLQIPMSGGADIDLWTSRGFPGGTLFDSNRMYAEKMFNIMFVKALNRSPDEILFLEHPWHIDKCIAFFAAMSYVIADLSIDIPRDIIYN